jgi:hypothetical protein
VRRLLPGTQSKVLILLKLANFCTVLKACGELSQNTFYHDVWKSYNGREWTLVALEAPWKAREAHQLVNAQVPGLGFRV